MLRRLGMKLHPEKTRQLNADGEAFKWLGHKVRWRLGGKLYLDISAKAQGRIRDELRRQTHITSRSLPEMVQALNAYIRGARQYFRNVVRRRLAKLDRFVIERMARWWTRKHSGSRTASSVVRGGTLWN